MNGKANRHLGNGNKIEEADKYEYLGGTITPNASRSAAISSKMSNALGASPPPQQKHIYIYNIIYMYVFR